MPQGNRTVHARTKYTDDVLTASADLLERMARACRMAASGECSMSEACRREGLDFLHVRGVLQTKAFAGCSLEEPPVPLADTITLEPSGAEQLYIDTFGVEDIGQTELPPDYEETLQDVLGTLTEREKDILAMRYGLDGSLPMTLEETGRAIGTGKERVRQIEAKALRKLRAPARSRRLTIGNAKWQAEQDLKEAGKKAYKEAVARWLDEEVQKAQEVASCTVDGESFPGKDIETDPANILVENINYRRPLRK